MALLYMAYQHAEQIVAQDSESTKQQQYGCQLCKHSRRPLCYICHEPLYASYATIHLSHFLYHQNTIGPALYTSGRSFRLKQ